MNPSRAVKSGLSVIRTYRRSAETTGVTVRVTPLGNDETDGMNATEPEADDRDQRRDVVDLLRCCGSLPGHR